ncbi:uncharacterized protein B0P05DRAFT_489781 [Gilbertella persicaria]|uniref:uncharacterized protein n=1 Tax=Gilbertella persicaria TaxID=101096 RepID=UPI00221E8E2C|nr:uncharacterized protein B0P05DRAFT_489781 [Gilbertella persicaria]KAI8081940.1 hypothetical protein B0P05DRAFT_489781 [Gilbertella persicaria]
MSQQRKKKTVEYHFVDMNDPDRYKKLKVARACDFCRKRKSKCDLGVPGSGTCSNCKKSNQNCIFSPVNPSKPQKTIKTHSFQPHDPLLPSLTQINYHITNPFFSLDPQGHCGYEKHATITYNHPSLHAVLHDMPSYSKHLEQEMFDVYFCYVHPYYPVLDRYSIMQALRYDSNAIPVSLKLAVISIALHFTPRYQDSETLANAYYQHACMQLNYEPTLMTLQTLFLLYKYQELLTPVGMPLTTVALDYLKQIQTMIPQLQQQLKENTATWAIQDEFLCRAGWILLIIVSMTSRADERWTELIQYCNTPSRLPILTETEHYDKVELNTTCSLVHFINLTLLYSRAIGFISDQSSLFTSKECPELIKLTQDLDAWKSTVPQSISFMLDSPQRSFDAIKQSTSFTYYLCLIHDIVDLLLSIHQQTDMVAKSIQLCKRTFQFCAHDMHRSRLASIQGSRLISYGLTLSLQSLSYCRLEHQDQQKKTFYYYCSLIFQTFDILTLLPNLHLSLQTLKTQIEAREKLSTVEKGSFYTTHGRFDQFSSSGSSSSSSGGAHSGKSSDYFSPIHPQDSSSSTSSSPYYHTRTTNTEQQSWPHHTHYQSYSHHYYDPPMPTTPTFEEDVGMSSVDYHHDPLTPPITFLSLDSYFQLPQPTSRDTLIAIQEPPHLFPLVIEASKSCKNKRLF